MLERDILRQVRDYLGYRKWFIMRIQQSMGSHKGMSDLIICKQGKVIFLEIKTPHGRLSHYQKKFELDLFREDIPYYVITDVSQLQDLGL